LKRKIFVSHGDAKDVRIDEFMTVFDYFTKKESRLVSLVTAKLDGPHTLRINRASEKLFFLIDGEADMVVDEQQYHLIRGDAVLVPINVWHSIIGRKAHLIIVVAPPYDPTNEEMK